MLTNYFGKNLIKRNSIYLENLFRTPKMNIVIKKNFSGGHEAPENSEDNYHERKLDRISYNRKLTDLEREK